MTEEPDTRPPTYPQSLETQSFEAALSELQTLVDTLEQGELTLEQSLATFERGIALTRTCREALDAAEQKVRILMGTSADAAPVPFERHD